MAGSGSSERRWLRWWFRRWRRFRPWSVARRCGTLSAALYARHANLVCPATTAPTELYTGTRLQGAFERTASRLIEMQSAEYLGTAHKA